MDRGRGSLALLTAIVHNHQPCYNVSDCDETAGRMKLVVGALTTYEVVILGLAQAEVIPGGLWEIAKDFPVLVVFLATLYYLMRWLDRMLEAQRAMLKEVYDSNQLFLANLLTQIEAKQNKMADRIELLTQQVAMSTATLSELTKVDDVIDRLMEKIQK